MARDTTFFKNLKLTDNQTIDVPRGKTYEITAASGLVITNKNLHIRATGSGTPPKIYFHGNDWAAALNCTPTSKDITIEGLEFDLGSKNLAVMSDGTNITLRKLGVLAGGGLTITHGVQNFLAEDCYADTMIDRNFILTSMRQLHDLTVIPNRNVTVRRCRVNGSRYEHGMRFHTWETLIVEKCIINNVDSPQGKQAINIRDGKDGIVRDTVCYGKNVIGPLADANGGINDPHGPERDRKLALRTRNLQIIGCTFTDWIILEAGVIDLHMELTCCKSTHDGHVFEFSSKYGPRDYAAGTMKNVKANYIGSGVFNTGHRDNMHLTGVTFNGSPVT